MLTVFFLRLTLLQHATMCTCLARWCGLLNDGSAALGFLPDGLHGAVDAERLSAVLGVCHGRALTDSSGVYQREAAAVVHGDIHVYGIPCGPAHRAHNRPLLTNLAAPKEIYARCCNSNLYQYFLIDMPLSDVEGVEELGELHYALEEQYFERSHFRMAGSYQGVQQARLSHIGSPDYSHGQGRITGRLFIR